MIDFFQQIYDGIFRFRSFKRLFEVKASHKGNFPVIGFLNEESIEKLEHCLSISIKHPEYFEQALIHRSYLQVISKPGSCSNERLEFLGDAVLGMITAEYLFSLHTNVLEGELTKMRSWLVNKHSLAMAAKKINLDDFLQLSYSAEKSLKKGSESILADALEAVIAAIYLDSGIEQARKFIRNTLFPVMLNRKIMSDKNFKSILLEAVQSEGKSSPVYHVISEIGPDHDKEFKVGVYVDDILLGQGSGKSKKEAEQDAAKHALKLADL